MKLDYELLVAETPAPRYESLNVGLLIWRNGLPEILCGTTPTRLAALDPNYPRMSVFKSLLNQTLGAELAAQVDKAKEDRAVARTLIGMLISPMKLSGGGYWINENGDFSSAIANTMELLVKRPAISIRNPTKKQPSKLQTQMRAWFRGAHIMGRGMEDLSRSRVVAEFPVSVDSDVYADFAYKNGALHVIETLDLRGIDHLTTSMKNTAAFKSITLDMAKEVVGEKGQRIGVVAASDYSAVKPALNIFDRNADRIYALDSPADAQALAELLAFGLHLDGGLLPAQLS